MTKYEKRKLRIKRKKQKNFLLFLALILLLAVGMFLGREEEKKGGERPEEVVRDENDNCAKEASDILEVHFIDVGQGDATLIKCGSHAMLIDAGDNSKGTAVQLYLKKQGVTTLDYLIGTHPDADHIGGLDVIITKFDCGVIMMPEIEREIVTYRDVTDAMEYKGYQNTPPVVGEKYSLGEAFFTIVAPVVYDREEYNNSSIGILLQHGETRFLFVGDAQKDAEKAMLGTGLDLQADVLKAGHHGSSDSGSAAFLDAVNPQYAVISCGQGNDYGHPHAATLNAFENREIQVYRTDEQGAVVASSDVEKRTFYCSPSASKKSGRE